MLGHSVTTLATKPMNRTNQVKTKFWDERRLLSSPDWQNNWNCITVRQKLIWRKNQKQSSPVQRPGLKKKTWKRTSRPPPDNATSWSLKWKFKLWIRLFMKFRIRSFILDVIYTKKQLIFTINGLKRYSPTKAELALSGINLPLCSPLVWTPA